MGRGWNAVINSETVKDSSDNTAQQQIISCQAPSQMDKQQQA